MSATPRRIVVAATPTPNGDLHVGHLAGPYLAGDIYARRLRASGAEVTWTTITDDSQTYVVASAARAGSTPERLTADSTAAIERSLRDMAIELTSTGTQLMPPVDEGARAAVTGFVTALYERGVLREQTVRLPYAERSGLHLYDGLLSGRCPACGAGSNGGACEDCGAPNNFDELLEPRYALDPEEPVGFREVTILVLPLEEYRAELTAHFAEAAGRWRPHPNRLIEQLLAGPLPVVPVTVPGEWGVPAPFAPTPGQIVYPWVEGMPLAMYATWWAQGQDPEVGYDEYWRAEHGAELVFLHGFDNVYHWGVVDLALMLAHGGRYVRPRASVVNEFYELEHAKFSTSRGHLIRGRELLADTPRDVLRLYLALTLPERERTNFDRAELAAAGTARIVGPWDELAALLDDLRAVRGSAPVPVGEPARQAARAFAEQVADCFELADFSVARAAALITDRIAELRDQAAAGAGFGDLLAAARGLLAVAAPFLVDTAAQARAAGVELVPDAALPEKITPFRLPTLTRRREER
ncbi:class I tRNA ligase family protein [Kitasatospora sp. NBC_01287]|uniref:class I tRNA ligase family protein n=1 Tax=Kitasatospora sp. NBC_01287 TaxID=2903573 RepID=UPI00225463F2|nr:class I tRNA ligase family protein [Kitasatospora sp. NBC_01287]MCX4749982.1 class I tRNA ligase family protein [Kitasatospora sp. NBC_01287]